ncbi:hypothetical protein LAZ67_8001513 [Cordylochernes scorpioides]|uniref:Uncharacterized protein n=1 Tax=Cordylochernes scorpioides TaxID=51811 RepID=A0ABY6KT41_9ARAC|nr:hypothetical protein LAZ67_8001513 [Cordylochernes scorpioides]
MDELLSMYVKVGEILFRNRVTPQQLIRTGVNERSQAFETAPRAFHLEQEPQRVFTATQASSLPVRLCFK